MEGFISDDERENVLRGWKSQPRRTFGIMKMILMRMDEFFL